VPDLPQQLGPYLLEAELGRGAMGVVYRARDTRVDRLVAIKLVLTEGETQAQRFEIEARAAARLRHKNLVAVHDLSREGNRVYLVSEFVQGRSLRDLLKERGRFEVEQAVELMARLCDGVEHAHQAGVIHRDIKPDNVLLEGDEPRLADFGIARIDEGGMTKTGQMLGTPSFMPPEQAGGERARIGPTSDVYSLGATLYSLLTGQPPFSGGSNFATVTAVLTKAPQPPSELAPVPPELEAIVLGCLAKEPRDRPASAAALSQALRDWQAGVFDSVLSQGQERAKRSVLVAGALTVATTALLGLYVAKRALTPPTLAKPPTPVATPTPTPTPTPLEETLRRASPLWEDPDLVDGDGALAAYLVLLREGVVESAAPLAEILVAGHGDEAQRRSAIAALRRLHERGSREATLALARVLTKGRSADPLAAQGYCKDLESEGEGCGLRWLGDLHATRGKRREAEIFYLAAKKTGDKEAQVRLGELLLWSERRVEEGLLYLGGAQGDQVGSASKAIGDAFRYARGVGRDLDRAEINYREAIQRGSVEARYELALKIKRQRPEEYTRLLREGSRLGDPRATAALSREKVASDPAGALRLARWASSRGHELATVWVAQHHLDGRGTKRDVPRGLEILRRAARRGNPRAQTALGIRLHEEGQVDRARALWREQIERDQDAEAKARLSLSVLDGEPPPNDEAKAEALQLLEEAALRGQTDCSLRLAEAYEFGPEHALGLEVDLSRALKFYLLGGLARGADLTRVTEKIAAQQKTSEAESVASPTPRPAPEEPDSR